MEKSRAGKDLRGVSPVLGGRIAVTARGGPAWAGERPARTRTLRDGWSGQSSSVQGQGFTLLAAVW